MSKCCFCKERVWFWQDKSIYAYTSHAQCHWGYVLTLLDNNDSESMLNTVLRIQDYYKDVYGGSWPYTAPRYIYDGITKEFAKVEPSGSLM